MTKTTLPKVIEEIVGTTYTVKELLEQQKREFMTGERCLGCGELKKRLEPKVYQVNWCKQCLKSRK